MDTLTQLRKRLRYANLSELARLTGVNVRTLRRIKGGQTKDVRLATANAIDKALAKAARELA